MDLALFCSTDAGTVLLERKYSSRDLKTQLRYIVQVKNRTAEETLLQKKEYPAQFMRTSLKKGIVPK